MAKARASPAKKSKAKQSAARTIRKSFAKISGVRGFFSGKDVKLLEAPPNDSNITSETAPQEQSNGNVGDLSNAVQCLKNTTTTLPEKREPLLPEGFHSPPESRFSRLSDDQVPVVEIDSGEDTENMEKLGMARVEDMQSPLSTTLSVSSVGSGSPLTTPVVSPQGNRSPPRSKRPLSSARDIMARKAAEKLNNVKNGSTEDSKTLQTKELSPKPILFDEPKNADVICEDEDDLIMCREKDSLSPLPTRYSPDSSRIDITPNKDAKGLEALKWKGTPSRFRSPEDSNVYFNSRSFGSSSLPPISSVEKSLQRVTIGGDHLVDSKMAVLEDVARAAVKQANDSSRRANIATAQLLSLLNERKSERVSQTSIEDPENPDMQLSHEDLLSIISQGESNNSDMKQELIAPGTGHSDLSSMDSGFPANKTPYDQEPLTSHTRFIGSSDLRTKNGVSTPNSTSVALFSSPRNSAPSSVRSLQPPDMMSKDASSRKIEIERESEDNVSISSQYSSQGSVSTSRRSRRSSRFEEGGNPQPDRIEQVFITFAAHSTEKVQLDQIPALFEALLPEGTPYLSEKIDDYASSRPDGVDFNDFMQMYNSIEESIPVNKKYDLSSPVTSKLQLMEAKILEAKGNVKMKRHSQVGKIVQKYEAISKGNDQTRETIRPGKRSEEFHKPKRPGKGQARLSSKMEFKPDVLSS